MSYYINANGKNYGDKKYTRTTKPIKEVYRYKTLMSNENGQGQTYYPLFYIKDGSVPWFDPFWKTGEGITAYDTKYLPVMSFTISSISGKYYLNDLPKNPDTTQYKPTYYISYCTVPFLCKSDVYLGNKPIISMVDKTKGGKLSWRMSESNLVYYNNQHRSGPTDTYVVYCSQYQGTILYYYGSSSMYEDKWTSNKNEAAVYLSKTDALAVCSMLQLHKSNVNFEGIYQDLTYNSMNFNMNYINTNFNTSNFIRKYENDTSVLNPGIARFIESKPYYDFDSKFVYTSSFGFNSIAPSHITIKKSDLEGYNKLKVKLDGIYVHANSNYTQYYASVTSLDDGFINNEGSFGANEKNPYCQALFYATDNNDTWSIETPFSNYVNDGHVYSNLEYNSTLNKLVPKNTNDYTIKNIPYNDCYTDEIQELTNKRVWDNMIPVGVANNYHLWTSATEDDFPCEAGFFVTTADGETIHAQKCPLCNSAISETADFDGQFFYIQCNSNNINSDLKQYLNDIKVPIFTSRADTQPVGYYVATSNDRSYTYGAVCNGTGSAYKMSGDSSCFEQQPGYDTASEDKKWMFNKYVPRYRGSSYTS